MRAGRLEITDLLWKFDDDGQREAVVRESAVEVLQARGQRRAARMVRRLPVTAAGELDPTAMDAVGLRIHAELQRLGEELQLWHRTVALITELLGQLPSGQSGTFRLVDVGCGTGHVLRSIAYHRALPAEVELVGVDLNPVLVDEARRLASVEGLSCRFVAGDALAEDGVIEDGRRTVVISTGLLHHLGPDELVSFFAGHSERQVAAFAHWDIAPCTWSTLGAWMFHQARMREPISRHDGVLSARRAHPAAVLLDAVHEGGPSYVAEVREGPRWYPRALDVLRPLVGVAAP